MIEGIYTSGGSCGGGYTGVVGEGDDGEEGEEPCTDSVCFIPSLYLLSFLLDSVAVKLILSNVPTPRDRVRMSRVTAVMALELEVLL